MFSRVRIADAKDSDFLPGEIVERSFMEKENDRVKALKKKPAEYEDLFLGITKVSLSTESWLSAASFQETARVLINASVTGKIDALNGLKENVIIGRLIPAGTGYDDNYIDMPEEVEEDSIEEVKDEIIEPEVPDKESIDVPEKVQTGDGSDETTEKK